jgi:hypothetical protein
MVHNPKGPLPAVPNVLRMVIGGLTGTYDWDNVLHWQYAGPAPSASTLTTFAGGTATNWQSDMAPEVPSPTSLTKVTITDLSSESAAEGEWVGGIAGTRGDDPLPGNAAGLISYPVVNARYRGGHPRSYLVVGGVADIEDPAHWSTAFTAEYQAHWRSFTSATGGFAAAGMTIVSQVAVSYVGKYKPLVPGTNYPTPEILSFGGTSTGVSHQELASARRRIGRR